MEKLIVVEGPQGTGKTTLANYLRDNLAGSNLYRLSGQKDKKMTGKIISAKMYHSLNKYLKEMEDIPMDIIFDRTFFSEQVYASLGYKEYSFTDVYQELLKNFANLKYDIYIIVLYLENSELYIERLKRNHHSYQTFSKDNSLNQQNKYLELAREIKEKYPHIHVIELAMDDFSVSYQKINDLFGIN